MTDQYAVVDQLLDHRRRLPAQRMTEPAASLDRQIGDFEGVFRAAEEVLLGLVDGRRIEKFRLTLGRADVRKGGIVLAEPGFQVTTVPGQPVQRHRSEEHTSELQSRENLVCRLLL